MTEQSPQTKTHEQEGGFQYEVLANPYERMNYVHLTDELIAKMDGTDGDRPDCVIFLDKSARPINWMVRELWETLASKDDNGDTPERPQSLFVNIDARSTNIDISSKGIADLRSIYAVGTPTDGTDMMDAPSYLDDKNVLVVDEVSVSGDTISKASNYLSKAFPTANIRTHSWMFARPERPDLPATDNPRWYERNNDRYRSVREQVPEAWAAQLRASDPRIERGWAWLAKVPLSQEEGTKQLMREIHALADDVATGRLPYIPSFTRPDEEERIREFSGLEPPDFYGFVRWTKQHYWPDYNVASTVTDTTGPLSEDVAKDFAHSTHVARARRLGKKNPGRFEYIPDPRTPAAKAYSKRVGLATAALANQVKKV